MGYEVRIHIVQPWSFTVSEIPMGNELASIDLSKIGDGPLYQLFKSNTQKANEGVFPPFALYARNSDKSQEAAQTLRQAGHKELANAIEDPIITKDPYGYFLGINPLLDTIEALKQQIKHEEKEYGANKVYPRYTWALALLESIQNTHKQPLVISFGH